ncbi:MAG: IS5 family transposase [Candidatus Methanospirareceae archaeon]
MKNFVDFGLNEAYKRVARLGDKLAEIESLLDWEAFRPIVGELYDNKSERGGRPNIDEVLMIKLLVLQQWHGLSDPELEKQVSDRLSFMKFLGFPQRIPDFTTVWRFRDRLAETGRDRVIWAELQRQLDARGLRVRKGVVQDAAFITADPGHAKADTPRGEEAKTRRSADGTWMLKGTKSYFGYKVHSKIDTDFGLIRELETTTAAVHDSQVDLSNEGEVVYRDRGYQGAGCRGYSATMKRGARDHPVGIADTLRNIRISKKRAPGERHYAVIKRVFNAGHVLVTTVERANVKMIFTALGFNLYQLRTLKRQGVI